MHSHAGYGEIYNRVELEGQGAETVHMPHGGYTFTEAPSLPYSCNNFQLLCGRLKAFNESYRGRGLIMTQGCILVYFNLKHEDDEESVGRLETVLNTLPDVTIMKLNATDDTTDEKPYKFCFFSELTFRVLRFIFFCNMASLSNFVDLSQPSLQCMLTMSSSPVLPRM